MSINSETELEGMKRAGAVVAKALAAMKAAVEPGVTPAQLNDLCGEVVTEHDAVSAPYLEYGAPVHAFFSATPMSFMGCQRTDRSSPATWSSSMSPQM